LCLKHNTYGSRHMELLEAPGREVEGGRRKKWIHEEEKKRKEKRRKGSWLDKKGERNLPLGKRASSLWYCSWKFLTARFSSENAVQEEEEKREREGRRLYKKTKCLIKIGKGFIFLFGQDNIS
jgi:hypothetical protein